jgi:hypothetical protein
MYNCSEVSSVHMLVEASTCIALAFSSGDGICPCRAILACPNYVSQRWTGVYIHLWQDASPTNTASESIAHLVCGRIRLCCLCCLGIAYCLLVCGGSLDLVAASLGRLDAHVICVADTVAACTCACR